MKYFLIVLVFVSGMSSLAIKMCASRFLAAYFGTSIYVWTAIISLILLSLTIGYFFGGKLADHYPHERALCAITAAAALSMSLIPFVAQGILPWSTTIFQQFLLTAFLDAILLFAIPVALLGCVSPFAIRLITHKIARSGRVSGSFYAISTIGSIIGVFLQVLWLIPAYGVQRTMLIFAALLFAASLWGVRLRWRPMLLLTLIPLVLPLGPLKTIPYLLYEQESYYNYIQVTQLPDGTRQLLFKEFFTLVRSHLSSNGVVVLNTIHGRSNFSLVQAFVNTMSQVFPTIYEINVPGTLNTVLMATLASTSTPAFQANLARLAPTTPRGGTAILGQVAQNVIPAVTQGHSNDGIVFTDDRAPVEQLTDQLIFTHWM